MPNPVLAVAGVGAGTSALSAQAQSKAAASAGAAQSAADALAIEEQRRQFDKVQELLSPFVQGGTDAFSAMASLAGVQGPDQQADAIAQIQQGPEYQTMLANAEEAMLQNAAATGGLRGGNTQRALAELRPDILAATIGQQYGRLGGLAGMGQASAAGVGSAAQSTGANIGQLMQSQGAAMAGSALGRGKAAQQGFGGIGKAAGFVGSYLPEMPEGATIFGPWGF